MPSGPSAGSSTLISSQSPPFSVKSTRCSLLPGPLGSQTKWLEPALALMRFDPEQGRPVTQVLNVRQALMGDLSQDVPLEDEDVIVIGRSLIARISYALNLFTRPFRDILGFLLFFREIGDSADTLFSP